VCHPLTGSGTGRRIRIGVIFTLLVHARSVPGRASGCKPSIDRRGVSRIASRSSLPTRSPAATTGRSGERGGSWRIRCTTTRSVARPGSRAAGRDERQSEQPESEPIHGRVHLFDDRNGRKSVEVLTPILPDRVRGRHGKRLLARNPRLRERQRRHASTRSAILLHPESPIPAATPCSSRSPTASEPIPDLHALLAAIAGQPDEELR
jgi:hypothetical protein